MNHPDAALLIMAGGACLAFHPSPKSAGDRRRGGPLDRLVRATEPSEQWRELATFATERKQSNI